MPITAGETTTATKTTTPVISVLDNTLYPKRLPLTKEFVKTNRILEVVADLPISSKQTMGYSAHELILDCEFAGSKCDKSDFASFYDTQHGNCYIFNSAWNKTQPPRVQQRAGTSYGLGLTLNIGQDDYVKDLGGSAGARIVVHPQDRMPFPKDEGVLTAPGQMTIIGIRQLNVVRLPEPYGNCTDTTERNIKRSVFEEAYPVGYSISTCYATCYQRYVIERCSCADPQYPMEGAAFDYKRVSACNSNNATEDTCRYHVSIDYAYNRLDCDCPLPCEETGYTYQTSSSIWPSDAHKENVKQKLASEIARYLGNTTDEEKLWNNLLKVKVYFEEFNYESIEEMPAYSTINFASDIGGILGLWIGCSIISIFEFLELSMDVVVLAVMRVFRRQRAGNTRPGTVLVRPTRNAPPPLWRSRVDQGNGARKGVTSHPFATVNRQRTLQRHGASPFEEGKNRGMTNSVLSSPDI
ncbi:Amiloride-sensitive sodium channel subunit beta [Lamellibrachia satsuma]|nr:Amiloride-sensitive sodium channel subunit beta [Lamellibrachia satsuma]